MSAELYMLAVLLLCFHYLNRAHNERDKLAAKYDQLQDKYIALLESLDDDEDDDSDGDEPDEPEPTPNYAYKEQPGWERNQEAETVPGDEAWRRRKQQ